MSAAIVRAHGGSKNLKKGAGEGLMSGMFIHDTMVGKDKPAHMKHLAGLISNTTGVPREKPVLDGVIHDTKQGAMDKDVPELHKSHHRGKTQPKTYGQVPYAGPEY